MRRGRKISTYSLPLVISQTQKRGWGICTREAEIYENYMSYIIHIIILYLCIKLSVTVKFAGSQRFFRGSTGCSAEYYNIYYESEWSQPFERLSAVYLSCWVTTIVDQLFSNTALFDSLLVQYYTTSLRAVDNSGYRRSRCYLRN